MVKTDDGRWVTFSRYVAEAFATKCGVVLPTSGIRIEMTEVNNVIPRTIMLKIHRGERIPLTAYVQRLRECGSL